MTTLEHRFLLFRNITYGLYALLLALFLFWNLQQLDRLHFIVLALQLLPLLALLPGLLSQYYRVFSWLCFVMLLYFVFAVMGAMSSMATAYDIVFLILCVLLFSSSMFCSRYAQRVQKGRATED